MGESNEKNQNFLNFFFKKGKNMTKLPKYAFYVYIPNAITADEAQNN